MKDYIKQLLSGPDRKPSFTRHMGVALLGVAVALFVVKEYDKCVIVVGTLYGGKVLNSTFAERGGK